MYTNKDNTLCFALFMFFLNVFMYCVPRNIYIYREREKLGGVVGWAAALNEVLYLLHKSQSS